MMTTSELLRASGYHVSWKIGRLLPSVSPGGDWEPGRWNRIPGPGSGLSKRGWWVSLGPVSHPEASGPFTCPNENTV